MDTISPICGKDSDCAALSDDELVERVKDLAAGERHATVALIRSLVEFDARKLYLREGCSSLFIYCTQVLHLAEASAYNRIETARAARRHSKVLEALERGDLTLTAVRLLAPYLTASNHAEVLAAARHKTKREIQELIVSLHPRPAAPTIIRRLSPPSPNTEPPSGLASAQTLETLSVPAGALTGPPPQAHEVAPTAARERRADEVIPLAPEFYKLQVTLTRDTHDKLRRAQAIARHMLPSGDIGAIIDRALTLLLDQLERRRFARVLSPRLDPSGGTASGRYIPAAVRRAVWERDEGQCAFVGRTGRCRETGFLEFHHVAPYAVGGPPTTDNIELRCRSHNQYEARLVFGDMLVPDRQSVTAPERDVGIA